MGSSNAKIGPARTTAIKQVASGNGVGNIAAFASQQGHSHVIRAICSAGQTIYIGRAADIVTVSATVKSYPLRDGEFLVVEAKDVSDYCHFADAAGAIVALVSTSFY